MENMFIEYQSPINFDQTVEKLSETILNGGWKIPTSIDLQNTLANNNIIVLPIKVIELCNPVLASQILKISESRIYSSMLPCRISIYEKEDGKTYLSIINTAIMSSQIGGIVENTMNEAFTMAEKFINIVLEK